LLTRIALLVLYCLAAGALAPPSYWAGDRRDGKQIAALARQGQLVERGSRRDRDVGSQHIDSAIWLHPASGRLLGCTNAARSAHQLLLVTTLPFYHLATHLSL
jgi:hypothetical protein